MSLGGSAVLVRGEMLVHFLQTDWLQLYALKHLFSRIWSLFRYILLLHFITALLIQYDVFFLF